MLKISEHVTFEEAFKSDTAIRKKINNVPTDREIIMNMQHVAKNVFEPIRKHFNIPIGITSFYRCEALNKAIGGSKTSQHVLGEAIDIDADIYGGITNAEIYEWVKNNLNFDQLIWEYGNDKQPSWVHISLKRKGPNRKQVLKIK